MSPDDLVITGLGVWSARGTTPAVLLDAALRGQVSGLAENFGERPFAVCRASDPPHVPGFPQAHRMDRSAQLALAAAVPACQEARLTELESTRVAVVVGNSRGPMGKWSEARDARRRPTQAAHAAIASLSGALSLALRIRGPCLTVSATCASSAHAIAMGALLIQGGLADAVLTGGAEAPLVRPLLEQMEAAGILDTQVAPSRACRPFDQERGGTIPGEGAGFLVLERASHAAGRGVQALAALAGFAMGSEGHHRVAARPDGEGLFRAMQQAMVMAGVPPHGVGYVNAHGTATRINDAAEAAALRRAFGASLAAVPVSSTKAVTGHAFGAAAALEAVLAIESLRRGLAPPTVGCRHPDPALGFRPLIDAPCPIRRPVVMSNSLGFWGNTASLIFRAL